MAPKPKPLADRFWPKVNKNGPIVRTELGPCWLWMGSRDNKGYGRIHYHGYAESHELLLTHRASWLIEHGSVPDELHVCHKCDNPQCVRPSHLFLGTKSDNMRDAFAKGRGRHCRFSGESHPMAKITESEVIEIRRRIANGETRTEVAKDFPVSLSSISHIANRKTWVDVESNVVLHDDEAGCA